MALRTLRLPSGVRLDNGGGSVVVNGDGTVTVTGNMAATLSTAAQPNVTSLGILTSLTASGLVDITGGGLRSRGVPGVPAGSVGTTNAVVILSAQDSGTEVYTAMYAGATLRGRVGFSGDAIVMAGITQATDDLSLYANAAWRAFVDASDSGRLILGGGVRLGSAAGLLIAGATSGVVTITTNATAGTWTMELPAAVPGTSGDQLSATTLGVCSWTAAGSLREWKDIIGVLDPQLALRRIVEAPVELWRYRKDAKSSTGDFETIYAGVVADRAPWALHFGGTKLSDINTSGHAFAAIQALYQEMTQLRAQVRALEAA